MTDELKKAIDQLRSVAPQPIEVTGVLKQAMDQLRSVSRQLNEATDEATRLIVRVERFLDQECSLGIPAGVILSETQQEGGPRKRVELKYGRLDRSFGLSITTKTLVGDVVVDRTAVPLAQAPREERLRAVAELPTLLTKLAQKATDLATKAQASSQAVSRVIGPTENK
jgi:ABC-type transporter Mla subunit MlaD